MTEPRSNSPEVFPKKTGIKRLLCTIVNTGKGLRWMMKESAFRQELFIAVPLCILTFYLDISNAERLILCLSLVQILMMEMINTAIELSIDRISLERHPLSGAAKDVGSALVGVSLLVAATVWAYILI